MKSYPSQVTSPSCAVSSRQVDTWLKTLNSRAEEDLAPGRVPAVTHLGDQELANPVRGPEAVGEPVAARIGSRVHDGACHARRAYASSSLIAASGNCNWRIITTRRASST